MYSNISCGSNSHIICNYGRIRIYSFCRRTRRDASSDCYILAFDSDTMVCMYCSHVVICNFRATGCYITCSIDSNRVKFLASTNVSLQINCTVPCINLQTGIGRVGFTHKANSRFTTKISIVPLVITTIANSKERTIIIRLMTN